MSDISPTPVNQYIYGILTKKKLKMQSDQVYSDQDF